MPLVALGERNMDTRTRQEWINWLSDERGISPSTMIDAKLSIDVEKGELAIPVFDTEGEILFYKYRRAPWRENGPKYRYETGSTAALYGAETLASIDAGSQVIITEGELDALALRSLGSHAVSSTGGSGTWRQEWSDMLTPFNVVICYDADRAGVEGALRVAAMTPHARIVRLPVQLGKDPTEIIQGHNVEALEAAIYGSRKFKVPAHGTEGRLKKLKLLNVSFYEVRKGIMNDPDDTPLLVDMAIDWTNREIEVEKDAEKYRDRTKVTGKLANDIDIAKTFPISELIKVNRERKAFCPGHQEDTPSLHVYADNHSYCFGGCGKRYDAIDIYKALHNCDTKTAIAALI